MNYTDVLIEELLKESAKTDFLAKFGVDIFNTFEKAKWLLNNNGISTDYQQYLDMDQEELINLIDSLYTTYNDNKKARLKSKGKYNYLGEKNGYKVYQPLDAQAAIELSINTGWGSAGRYGYYGNPKYIPNIQTVREVWRRYTNNGAKIYYFLNPSTMYGEYALILNKRTSIDSIDNITKPYRIETNFELLTADDKKDYSNANKLPLDLIPEQLILTIDYFDENGLIIKNNRLIKACREVVKDVIIPKSVTAVNDCAFKFCSKLTSVTFEEGSQLSCIPDAAFQYCTNLLSINIPNTVTEIGEQAFFACHNLQEVHINNLSAWLNIKMDEFCASPFDCNNATLYLNGKKLSGELEIPNGITSLDPCLLGAGNELTSIIIPSDIKNISPKAFVNCSNLTSIIVKENPVYHSAGNCLIKTKSKILVHGCNTSIIPTDGSVTSIANEAFAGSKLKSITIPDSVLDIGTAAFMDCSSLTDVVILNSKTTIGYRAFENCTSLTSITGSVDQVGEAAVASTASAFSVNITSGITIPNNTFYGCTGLTSITIPNSVTSIRECAFNGCSNLTSINYIGNIASWCEIAGLNNLMSLSSKLFINGKELEGELVIPDNIINIPSNAFCNCSKLTSVVFPASIESIGDSAFTGCSGLIQISGNEISTSTVIKQISQPCSVTITSGTSISSYAFCDCSNLMSVKISNGIESIGDYAFQDCTSLTSITIPSSITTIGHQAFYGCSNLTSVNILDGVRFIGISAFENCESLSSIILPNSVITIDDCAFQHCENLKSITLPQSLKNINLRRVFDRDYLEEINYLGTLDEWKTLTKLDTKFYKNVKRINLLNCYIDCITGKIVELD